MIGIDDRPVGNTKDGANIFEKLHLTVVIDHDDADIDRFIYHSQSSL
jgi:hypothetical protein